MTDGGRIIETMSGGDGPIGWSKLYMSMVSDGHSLTLSVLIVNKLYRKLTT